MSSVYDVELRSRHDDNLSNGYEGTSSDMQKGEIIESILGLAVDEGQDLELGEVTIDLTNVNLTMDSSDDDISDDEAEVIEGLTSHDQTWYYNHGIKLSVRTTTFFFNHMMVTSIVIFSMYNLINPIDDDSTAVYISLLGACLGTTYKNS